MDLGPSSKKAQSVGLQQIIYLKHVNVSMEFNLMSQKQCISYFKCLIHSEDGRTNDVMQIRDLFIWQMCMCDMCVCVCEWASCWLYTALHTNDIPSNCHFEQIKHRKNTKINSQLNMWHVLSNGFPFHWIRTNICIWNPRNGYFRSSPMKNQRK